MDGNNQLKSQISNEDLDTVIEKMGVSNLIDYLSNALADTYTLYLQTQGVH